MKSHQCDENPSPWWNFFTLVEIHRYDENSSLRWTSSLSWLMKMCYYYEHLWQWFDLHFDWLMNDYHFDTIPHINENVSIWWKYITVMEVHHCDENLSLWFRFIHLMTLIIIMNIFINMMKIDQGENFAVIKPNHRA